MAEPDHCYCKSSFQSGSNDNNSENCSCNIYNDDNLCNTGFGKEGIKRFWVFRDFVVFVSSRNSVMPEL